MKYVSLEQLFVCETEQIHPFVPVVLTKEMHNDCKDKLLLNRDPIQSV